MNTMLEDSDFSKPNRLIFIVGVRKECTKIGASAAFKLIFDTSRILTLAEFT